METMVRFRVFDIRANSHFVAQIWVESQLLAGIFVYDSGSASLSMHHSVLWRRGRRRRYCWNGRSATPALRSRNVCRLLARVGARCSREPKRALSRMPSKLVRGTGTTRPIGVGFGRLREASFVPSMGPWVLHCLLAQFPNLPRWADQQLHHKHI